MGPTWVLLAPDGPHVGPIYISIRFNLSDVNASDHQNGHSELHKAIVM